MGGASPAELFFAAYGRVEWRDKLWKLLQNVARLLAWAVSKWQGTSLGYGGGAAVRGAAVALAGSISSSRKGFRMGKWLLPLQRLLAGINFFVRGGAMEASLGSSVKKQLANTVARGCMLGYGVWDNLVFLSSAGTLGDHALSQKKMFKIRSHRFRFFGNVLDAGLAYIDWSRMKSSCDTMVGAGTNSTEQGEREHNEQRFLRQTEEASVPGTGDMSSNRCRMVSCGDMLQQKKRKKLHRLICKSCSAFESFSHSKFCMAVFGGDVSPGLIGLSGILSSLLVLWDKWPAVPPCSHKKDLQL